MGNLLRDVHLSLPAGQGVIGEVDGRDLISSAKPMTHLVHSARFDGGTAQLCTLGIFDPPHDKKG